MSNFLDKFKTKVKSKKPVATVSKEELKVFNEFIIENSAWTETLRETIVTAAKARSNLKTRTKAFWDKITPKYKLDINKYYSLDIKTGEITLSKDQPIKKEVKK